jgi:RNA polymerase sigma factor FliA
MPLVLDRPAAEQPVADPQVGVDELVRQCLPLVGHLVREVTSRAPAHVNRDELVSAAMFALATSAKSFDPTLGAPFARFAAIRMRGALIDELRSMDWASRTVRGKAREVDATRSRLTQALHRTPSSQEIAQAMGVSTDELSTIAADAHRASVVSLQSMSPEEGDEVLPARTDGPESVLLRREQLGYLRDAIAELPDRLRLVVEQYFFGQRKMADIAAELGVTESRISQLRSQALAMLRDGMQAAGEVEPLPTTSVPQRSTSQRSYRAAVAGRSTMVGRLAATTILGEARRPVRLAN